MIESAERAATAPGIAVTARSLWAWVGVAMAAVALGIGAIGLAFGPNWTLLWAAMVLLVLAIVTSSIVRRMGYGRS